MRISFYLDKPDRSSSSVLLNIALASRRIRLGTGVIIAPKNWNQSRQKVRSTDPQRNAHQKRLDLITSFVTGAYNKLAPAGESHVLTSADIDVFVRAVRSFASTTEELNPNPDDSFESIFQNFIETYTLRKSNGMITTKRPSAVVIKLYSRVLADIKQWSTLDNYKLTFESIDEAFYQRYYRWLSEDRGLADSSISNHVKVIKTFMKWARQKGFHNTSAWENFWRDRRNGDTIALTVNELRQIRDVDLSDSPRLERIRNIFLLQCFTGLRYGDLVKLQPNHFDHSLGMIRYITEKTDSKCLIPITAPLQEVLNRYPSTLPAFPSNVKCNLALKTLGLRVGLVQPTTTSKFRNGKRNEVTQQRFELLTTHVARRTFISTSIRFGVSEAVISKVTGHAAKGMLQQHYIVLDEEAIRDIICKAWEQL